MFFVLLCSLDALLLGLGIWLAMRPPCRSRWRSFLIWTAFGLVCVPGMMSVFEPLYGAFAAMRAGCHGMFCVFLPARGFRAIRLLRISRGTTIGSLLVVLACEGCYVWALEVEPFRLEVTRARITSPRLRELDRPVRIAAIADLQPDAIGPYEVSVFDTIVAEQPDLIVFLGDTLCYYEPGFAAQRELLHQQLARLTPRLGMFAVDGDLDANGARDIFAGTAVRVLVDDHSQLPDVPIEVLGLSRGRSRRHDLDIGTVRRLSGDRFPIVLGHAPDYMRSVLDGGLRTDALFLAGHTHGGQVQIPGFGPLITLSSVPRWLAGGGVFHPGDTWLAVSRGIGMERELAPRIRFYCRPQLLLLELSAP
jgi:uncharacterized protein